MRIFVSYDKRKMKIINFVVNTNDNRRLMNKNLDKLLTDDDNDELYN